ncbi:preprotein translocase subunit YajC [Candidatus Clostridium stratigraminis]|uniref:Preprotein translocase subunit YajC n=1 Tax=Candidatus Clostridium stratigraminis TaxID=3381661 RepID=A0ABW8T4J3_9CLOT
MASILQSPIMYFVIMIALFYLFILVPENRRKKKYSSMLGGLKVNDEIASRGGIIGKIVTIQDKFVILETGPDRVRIKLDKNGISHVMSSREPEAVETKEN